jgi:two-component system C4-dicarboxylate transport sensor histidine kinase DctB
MFAGVALIIVLSLGASRWAESHAAAVSDVSAGQAARINAGLLASELQKFRLLPLVLSEYPDVSAVLEREDPEATARLNGKLEMLAGQTDAAVIYVMCLDGRTIVASNWRRGDSFVGHHWQFRPYFSEAMRTGSAELFALGTVSSRPGLYIARRISRAGRPLGVVVVKVEFDRLEAAWARQAGPTFVTDGDGVVMITSRPEWRFKALRRLTPEKVSAANRTLQFGRLPLAPLNLSFDGATVREQPVGGQVSYRAATLPVPLSSGELRFLQPLEPAMASATSNARLAILGGVILVATVLGLMLRAREKALMQVTTRRALETEVTLRTAELTEVNHRLIEESRERIQADRALRSAREELAQANRLGSIGQITAGVAHEINQPVAAIRTFAENAGQFLERGQDERARDNLARIVGLTARIGSITAELRNFSRRGTPTIGVVEVAAAIDGALLLMGDRIRSQGVALDRSGCGRDVCVEADRVRLEQVLINLIQNALEALDGWAYPRLRISIEPVGDDHVYLEVVDNGPGVPAELADQIFTPFITGRPDGLGLGLGIARDIAREFGGELEIIGSRLGGAGFRLSLRRA